MKLLFCVVIAATVAAAQSCRVLQRHGELKQAAACYAGLTRSSDALERAQGWLGLERYQEANTEFQQADKTRPNSAAVKAEWARMFAQYAQPGDAAKLYQEAIEADASYAPAYLGLARVLSETYDKKAEDLANAALRLDPKLSEAHEILAYLALEDGDHTRATEEAKKALALTPEALDGWEHALLPNPADPPCSTTTCACELSRGRETIC